jgi:hypothetical protein
LTLVAPERFQPQSEHMAEESPIKRLFVLHEGQETGPLQFREVMDQLRAGSLALDDPGWLEGSTERAPLRSILPKLGPPLPSANARPAAAQRPPALVVSGPAVRSPPKPTDSTMTHKPAAEVSAGLPKKGVSIAGKAPIVRRTRRDRSIPGDPVPKPTLDARIAAVESPFLQPISGDLQSDPNATLDAPKPLSDADVPADDERPPSSAQNVAASTDKLADSLNEKVVIRAPDSPALALSRPKAMTGVWGWIIAALLLAVLLLVIVLRPRQPTAEQTPPQPALAPSTSVAPTPEVSSTQRSQPDQTSTKTYTSPTESPAAIDASQRENDDSWQQLVLELRERNRKLMALETRQNSPGPAASAPPTVVAPVQTPPAASPSGAMLGERFPQTRTRIMTATEVQSWSAKDIQYAINEIYARNGADFQDAATKSTFAKFPWYHPRVRVPLSEIEHSFWAVEADNAKLLGYYRDAMSKRERFPETRTRSMTHEEVRSWSDDKLRYAINEMYARHGAEIENPMVRKQFSGLDWYRPVPGKTYNAAENEFSAVEKYNVHLLAEYRKALQNKAKQPTPRQDSRLRKQSNCFPPVRDRGALDPTEAIPRRSTLLTTSPINRPTLRPKHPATAILAIAYNFRLFGTC